VSDPARSILVIACGALARELKALSGRPGLQHITLRCLPANLHNTPEKIPTAVRAMLEDARERYDDVFVAYADCGTGGRLDAVLSEYGVERLPGAHCYEFFTGSARFAALQDEELGTFYLTDFLLQHFDRLVIRGLGIDRYPELRQAYFGNYRRMLYLAQSDSVELEAKARGCADRLGLEYELERTGLDNIERSLRMAVTPQCVTSDIDIEDLSR